MDDEMLARLDVLCRVGDVLVDTPTLKATVVPFVDEHKALHSLYGRGNTVRAFKELGEPA